LHAFGKKAIRGREGQEGRRGLRAIWAGKA